ncbi:MAG TPA: septal ring lytic transglycosylase RlpA family protein [Actinomycetota bacterium]|nr:septal ring lytic transglycosylase RlpA family protein [Actinomycetota bacterium]
MVAAAALVAAVATRAPAQPSESLTSLQEHAQRLGDNVTGLERDLQVINDKKARLTREITEASAEIGVLEDGVHDAELAYQAALDAYVARAVDAYKDGASVNLDYLLSAETFEELDTVMEARAQSAGEFAEALRDAQEKKAAAERVQAQIDERKQKLLDRNAEVTALSDELATTLQQRRSTLRALSADITKLQRMAAAEAARSAQPDQTFTKLLHGSGPAQGIPDGYAGTGVSFSGIASWYGPGFEGQHTANGDIFDPDLFTAASRDLPLGTWLYVQHDGHGVVVLVNDRGPYIDDRILDLSQAAAEAIGITGLGWIDAEILVKT